MNSSLFSHASPVFQVEDINKTLVYYEQKLGFEVTFKHGEPIYYAVVKRGEGVSIHFAQNEEQEYLVQTKTCLYVFVCEVDKVYQEFVNKDIKIAHPITSHDYGMRDFDILDVNGYRIAFGQSLNL